MGLDEYQWRKEELDNTGFAGKYVTHDYVNKQTVINQVDNPDVDLELGEHTLEYAGKEMDVRLDVNNRWAAFFYDQTFEEQLGNEDFEDVLVHFLTPDMWKTESALKFQ